MTDRGPDTEELLRRVEGGDPLACDALLHRHRARLRQPVALRMDPRLAARVDASDVVQETLARAHEKREQFRGTTEAERAAWLRQILANQLAAALRRYFDEVFFRWLHLHGE